MVEMYFDQTGSSSVSLGWLGAEFCGRFGRYIYIGFTFDKYISSVMTLLILIFHYEMISDDLGGTATGAFWAGTSFLLTSCVYQLRFSLSSDIFGRKLAPWVAEFAFTVGCITAALSHAFPQMLVGRSIQGTGGGGIMALTEVLTADLIPLSHSRNEGNGSASALGLGLWGQLWALSSVEDLLSRRLRDGGSSGLTCLSVVWD
jgi:MFS family permease